MAARTANGRHRAFVTAPMRGPGLDKLASLADVVHEPWIDQVPLKLYDGVALADRLKTEAADIVVVEADFVNGPVWDLPLFAVAATRGDPNNIDVTGASAAKVPVLRAPGRNADAVRRACSRAADSRHSAAPPRRRRREATGGLPRRHHPLPAFPGLGAGGAERSDHRLRSCGPRPGVAPQRPWDASRHL